MPTNEDKDLFAKLNEKLLQESSPDATNLQQDLDMPKIYVRDFSIRINEGEEKFCSFIDLDPAYKLSISYKVKVFTNHNILL